MSFKNEYDSSRECSVELQLRIDQICDAFELRCQRNERPRIEDYLDETLGNVETQLAELVLVELVYRRKGGDTPTIDEYVTRFPNYNDVFKRLSDQLHPSAT